MHDRAEGVQARPTGARAARRWLACGALIAGWTSSAHADPETRPALSTHGWTVDLTGYVQVDAVAYAQASQDEIDPATGDVLAQEHFAIPRASLRADGHRGDWSAAVELEAFTSRATLPEPTQTTGVRPEIIAVGWRQSAMLEIDAGMFRTPFGASTPVSPRDRLFLELPTVNRALFPGDLDVGAMVHGAYGIARYSLAIMNGAPSGDAQWRGKDPSSSYDFVGRIGMEWSTKAFWGHPHVAAGVSALSGHDLHPGTPPTKDHLSWTDYNHDGMVEQNELTVIPGTPGEPSQGFDHQALGIDAAYGWCLQWAGAGRAFAEATIATNLDRGLYYADPIAANRPGGIRELGFQIGAVQQIGPRAQAGIRYDRYDADRDAAQQSGVMLVGVHRVFSTWAFMAAATWTNTRLMIEYDHQKNPLGRDDSGAPATREDDRVVLRAQVGF